MAKKTKLLGRNLMVWVAGGCKPLATSCQIQSGINAIDPETKDDAIGQTVDPDTLAWTLTMDNQSDDVFATAKALLKIAKSHSVVELRWGKPSNAGTGGVPTDGWVKGNGMCGRAYCSSVSYSGPVNGKATVSATFTGHGSINTFEEE